MLAYILITLVYVCVLCIRVLFPEGTTEANYIANNLQNSFVEALLK